MKQKQCVNCRRGRAGSGGHSTEFDEINARFGEELTPEEMDVLIERQGEVQEKLDHLNAWDLDSRLDLAMDALRCRPVTRR